MDVSSELEADEEEEEGEEERKMPLDSATAEMRKPISPRATMARAMIPAGYRDNGLAAAAVVVAIAAAGLADVVELAEVDDDGTRSVPTALSPAFPCAGSWAEGWADAPPPLLPDLFQAAIFAVTCLYLFEKKDTVLLPSFKMPLDFVE